MSTNKSGSRQHVLAIAAAAVLIAGFTGHLAKNFSTIPVASTAQGVKIVADSLLQTLQLFTLSSRGEPGRDNWLLVLARLGGAFVAFGAVGRVLLAFLAKSREKVRLASLRGHTVICGYGDRGRLFGSSAPASSCVAIDVADMSDASGAKLLRVQGNAADPDVLRSASIAQADTVVIGTGSDERNLAIARAVLVAATVPRETALDLIVTLDDPALADSVEREDAIVRPTGLARRVRVNLFNPARAAAVALLGSPLWGRRALELHQPRIRLAMIGIGDAAIETALQFLRVSPCCGLDKPRIEWFAPAAEVRSRLLARVPNLAHLLNPETDAAPETPLRWAADVVLHDVATESALIAARLQGEGADAWTGIVVAAASSVANIRLAIQLRRDMERLALPPCPIHVHAPAATSLDSLLAREDNGIHAFGKLAELCQPKPSDAPRERLARQLHEAYLRRRRADTSRPVDAGQGALREWDELAETYRRSNRRAADHLPVKWLSANFLSGRALDAPGFPETLTPELLEALAAIEHDAWRIDRELDGWRYAPQRDNARMRHPDLIPYAALSHATQEYDREQIRELWAFKPE